VVPIFHNATQAELLNTFNSINGIIFTGGGQYLKTNTTYYDAAEYLFNLTLQANLERNVYMPLWGTCMGFQLLHILISGTGDEQYILERYDSWDISYNLNFSRDASQARMFQQAPPQVMETFAKQPVTMNYHRWGISPKTFYNNQKIYNFFNVLSVNEDNQQKTFISTVEAKNPQLPIYGTQWHPEVPSFEFYKNKASHTAASIMSNNYMATFLVNEARKNNQKYATEAAEQAALIYNYNPVATEQVNGNEQTYYF